MGVSSSSSSTESLKEYEELTRDMVLSVVGLLKDQDLIFSAYSTIENNREAIIDETGQSSTATKNDLQECSTTALEHLFTTEVTERKNSTICSLHKFLGFLTETVKKGTENMPGDFGESSLNSYMKTEARGKQSSHVARLKSIMLENERLVKDVKYFKEKYRICEERWDTCILEKQNYTELEDNLEELKKEKDEQDAHFEKHTREMIKQINEMNLGFEQEIEQFIEVYQAFKTHEKKLNDSLNQNEKNNENDGHETLENPNVNDNISMEECEMDTSHLIFDNDLSSQFCTDSESEMTNLTGESWLLLQPGNEKFDERDLFDTRNNHRTNKDTNTNIPECNLRCDGNQLCCNFTQGSEFKTETNENFKDVIDQKKKERENCQKQLRHLGDHFRKSLTNIEHNLEMVLSKTMADRHHNKSLENQQAEKYKNKLQEKDDRIKELNESQAAMISQEHKHTKDLKDIYTHLEETLKQIQQAVEKQAQEFNTKLEVQFTHLDEAEKQTEKESEKARTTSENLEKRITNILTELEKERADKVDYVQNMQAEIQSQNAAIRDRYNEIVRLQKAVHEVETERDKLKSTLDENEQKYKDEISNVKTELDKCGKNAEEITKLNKQLENQNMQLNETLKQNQQEIEKAQKTYENFDKTVTEKLKNYENENNNKEKELCDMQDTMKKQEAELNAEIKDKETEVESMKEALQKLETEKIYLNGKLAENERKANESTEMKRKFEHMNIELHETVKQKQQDIEKVQKTYENLNNRVTEMLKKYENENENKEKELYVMQDKMNRQEAEFNSAIEDRETKLESMKEALQKLETEKTYLNGKLDENQNIYKDKLSNVKSELAENERKAKESTEIKRKLENKNKQLDETVKQKQQEIEKAHKTYDNLNNNVTDMLKKYENENKNKEIELCDMQDKMKHQEVKFNGAIKERETEIESMKKALQKLETEKTYLNDKLDENEKRCKDELSNVKIELEENERKAEENTELRKKLKNKNILLDETVKQKQQEIEKAHKTYENLNNNITEMLKKYENENKNKEKELYDMHDKMKSQEANFNAAIKERETEIESMNKALQELETEKTNLNLNFHDSEKRHTDTLDKIRIELKNCEMKAREADELNAKLIVKIAQMDEDLKRNQHEKQDLQTEMEKETKLKMQLKKEATENEHNILRKDGRIIKLKNELKTLSERGMEQQKSLESKYKTQHETNQRLERQIDMLRTNLNDKLKSADAEIEKLKSQLQEERNKMQKVTEEHRNLEEELSNEINIMKAGHSKYSEMKEEKVKMLEDMLKCTESSNTSLSKEICEEKERNLQKENHIVEKDYCIALLQQEKSDLNERLKKINDELTNSTKEKDSFRKELERIKSRKFIQVQLYSQSGSTQLSGVEVELIRELKSIMDNEEKVDVEILKCAKASDIHPEIPLFILCIQASRLGTAVANTVQGLNLTSKMAVLIFHYKDVHALPSQASERVLMGKELRNLGGIFDLAFLSEKGIYPCEMNKYNFVSLVNFLKIHGTKRTRDDI